MDPELDIAVLKVDKPDNQTTFNPLPFGNSDKVAPGMIVLACGNPYGLGTTVSRGIISARERKLMGFRPGSDSDGCQHLSRQFRRASHQHSRGNSRYNKSILPNTEKSYTGIGFAIPSNLVQHSFQQICVHGRPMRGYLGLDIVPNTPPLRSFLDYHEATGAVVNMDQIRIPG